MSFVTRFVFLFAFLTSLAAANIIKLEQIMADPDWLGNQPEDPYWADDGKEVFYWQKELGSDLRHLVRVNIDNGESERVAYEDYEQTQSSAVVYNQTRSLKAFFKDNNVFVKTLNTGKIKQLTKSAGRKRDLGFLNNGQVVFREEDSLYVIDIQSGLLEERVRTLLEDDPEKAKPEDFLAEQQLRLFDIVKDQKRKENDRLVHEKLLKQEDPARLSMPWYFGTDVNISDMSMSPNGRFALVTTSSKSWKAGKNDSMPKFVNEEGYTQVVNVRTKVGSSDDYDEKFWLLDLKTHERTLLDKNTLPEIRTERLSALKKQQAKREDKKYQKSEDPRASYLYTWPGTVPIKWNNNGDKAAFFVFSWDNKDRWLVVLDTKKKVLKSLDHDYDPAWVNDWTFNEFAWFSDKDSLYYLSEQSGYSHLYEVTAGGSKRQMTNGRFEVSDVTLTRDQKTFIFKANREHPGIYEIYLLSRSSRKLEQLTREGGINDYWLAPDEKQLLLQHSSTTRPPELFTQKLMESQSRRRITTTVSEDFTSMPWVKPEVVDVPSSNVKAPIYSRVYRPSAERDQGKAVIFVHGAGYLQNAHHGWSGYFREFMFHSLLTEHGYTVLDMDYRASKGYGRDWRTAIYRHMGKPELEDLIDGAKWLTKTYEIDEKKIGIYGGSYGGFMTFMAMFKAPDVFAAGASLRPVTDWAHYNHGYTSNILNTPSLDPEAYSRSSPIELAAGLKGPLLICHGMLDDNVFFQDSVRLVQRLIELKKPNFELAVYPVEPHGFKRPESWLDEYRRIFKLFEQSL